MAQPTPQPGPPRVRECTACGETFTSKHNDPDLIKPCSVCASDYCYDCLDSLFRNAAYQPGAMLPRCCALIQIHTITARLDSDTANAYRAKLAERISPDKFYCPAPSCSAFIHEKHVPLHQPSSSRTSAKRVFLEILDQVNLSPAARFFRTSELQASLPDYYSKVQEHTDLNMIRKKVDSDSYKTVDELLSDIHIIFQSAKDYNGKKHSVTNAAEQLETVARNHVSKCVDNLIRIASEAQADHKLFACPACHIAICTRCRAVAHEGQCDFSARDHEAAMLINFGYKRCPRCNHGVKKMYGCSHMQCVCGAHWCYHCEKSIEQCTGGCPEESEDEDSDEDTSEDESQPSADEQTPSSRTVGATPPNGANGVPGAGVLAPIAPTAISSSTGMLSTGRQPQNPGSQPAIGTQRSPTSQLGDISQLTVNLDGGGASHWAATELDFGDEPEEEPGRQIWSCNHKFGDFKSCEDGFYRGDLSKMECNRCFDRVVVKKADNAPPSKRRKISEKVGDGRDAEKSSESNGERTALQCSYCYLMVCARCKARFEAEASKDKRPG